MSEPAVAFMRSEREESVARADVAVVDSTGHVVAWIGNPARSVYWRSAAKPFQAAAFVASGAWDELGGSLEELAVVAGSHHGESPHVEAVGRLLDRAGLTPAHLRCGAAWPLNREARRERERAGGTPEAIYGPCSGKHAAMLATARQRGESLEDYMRSAHPVQRRVAQTIAVYAGLGAGTPVPEGVDGCGVPTYFLPLSRLAWAYARLTDPRGVPDDVGHAGLWVAEAMRRHPDLTAGTASLEVEAAAAAEGRVLVKVAAEGLFAAIIPELGWGIAGKIEDGGSRSVRSLAAALLALLTPGGEGMAEALYRLARQPIRTATGEEVGEVVPVFQLQRGRVG